MSPELSQSSIHVEHIIPPLQVFQGIPTYLVQQQNMLSITRFLENFIKCYSILSWKISWINMLPFIQGIKEIRGYSFLHSSLLV